MVDLILFPSSYFGISKVDEDLQAEYDAAINTELYEIVLFDYQSWFNDGKIKLNKIMNEEKTAVYRGWMMKPDMYDIFYNQLLEKNIRLVTNPQQYGLMHVFPNVYEKLMDDTARMMIFPLNEMIDVEIIKASFERFMVKDYVKSVKGTEFPRFFDNTIEQDEFNKWMDVFYKYRGNLLTGGICIKEFLQLKRYGDKTNEYRVFYINHEIATVSRNSGQGIYAPLPPQELIEKYNNLESDYYTIDYAELTDGTWKIIEAGDGEVSGLSENQDYEQYFRAMYQCFK